MHPRFWEMAGMAEASGARVGLTTNGTLLDRDNLERLLDTGIDVMGVSLAGTTTASTERFRQGCDLDQLDTSLRELAGMKARRAGKDPEVHLAYILLRPNWPEVADLSGAGGRVGRRGGGGQQP